MTYNSLKAFDARSVVSMQAIPLQPAAILLLLSLALPAVGHAETLLFGTGFEAPTYQPGVIGGGYYSVPQHVGATGWKAGPVEPYSANPSPWAVVTDQKAASGSQSLKLSIDPASNSSISVSRNLTPAGNLNLSSAPNRFGISLRLYLDQTAASDVSWSIGLAHISQDWLRMTLTPSGQVMYAQPYMNNAAFFTPGFDLKNTWLDVAIESDPADATSVLLSIAGRGQTWQASVPSPGGVGELFYVSGNWPTFPLYRSGTAYVDDVRLGYNLTAVPEPSSAALMLMGFAGLAGWRRRNTAK